MEWAKGMAGGEEIREQQWGQIHAAFGHGKDLGFYLSVGVQHWTQFLTLLMGGEKSLGCLWSMVGGIIHSSTKWKWFLNYLFFTIFLTTVSFLGIETRWRECLLLYLLFLCLSPFVVKSVMCLSESPDMNATGLLFWCCRCLSSGGLPSGLSPIRVSWCLVWGNTLGMLFLKKGCNPVSEEMPSTQLEINKSLLSLQLFVQRVKW